MSVQTIPQFSSLADALSSVIGSGASIARTAPVSGGDINRASCLMLKDGSKVFLKANSRMDIRFFQAESDGLTSIRETGAIRVPQVLALGTDEMLGSFLLLEWIERASQAQDYWESFGHRLAALHLADASGLVPGGTYGLARDNYIGARSQINTPCMSWIAFFRDYRLAPQFRDAGQWFDTAERKRIERLLDHLDNYMEEPERPSLLHGDLWSGNFMTGSDGNALLIDPATYVGHAEADLAMTELFGGFDRRFYDAYREVNPIRPGYERRRELYNLYHLLNHLNLFGGSYLSSVLRVLKRYGEE